MGGCRDRDQALLEVGLELLDAAVPLQDRSLALGNDRAPLLDRDVGFVELAGLVAHFDLEIADALLGHLEIGVLVAGERMRGRQRGFELAELFIAHGDLRAQVRDLRIDRRQRLVEAGTQLRLARLARGEIGFERRDLAVAARVGGTQVHGVGIQAQARAFRWHPARRAACASVCACAASSRSSAAIRSARANNSSSSSGRSER